MSPEYVATVIRYAYDPSPNVDESKCPVFYYIGMRPSIVLRAILPQVKVFQYNGVWIPTEQTGQGLIISSIEGGRGLVGKLDDLKKRREYNNLRRENWAKEREEIYAAMMQILTPNHPLLPKTKDWQYDYGIILDVLGHGKSPGEIREAIRDPDADKPFLTETRLPNGEYDHECSNPADPDYPIPDPLCGR